MKRRIALLALLAAALLAVACGAGETPAPTPLPVKEWSLERIRVDGSTVTVELRVFAGIDVQVALDGRPPDEVLAPPPVLEHVFKNVAPGQHTVQVRDIVGHAETREVLVPPITIDGGLPRWLTSLIQGLEGQSPANPPISITRYEFKGQTVYFETAPCCDFFSNLYDAEGNIISHPDGGISGQGDGRLPDFSQERNSEFLIWKDARQQAPGDTSQVRAPIESTEIQIAESFPLQYFLTVVSGLPDSCHTFGGYTLTRDGVNVLVRAFNLKPSDPNIFCALVYGMVETRIPLGSDYDPSTAYTVDVNGETISFKGDAILMP